MTIEEILKEALKYETKTSFEKGNRKAYKAAKKMGVYKDATAHMKVRCRSWSDQDLAAEALKYKTRNDFNKGSSSAYQIAHSRKLLDTICSHMPKRIDMSGENNPNYRWSNEDLAAIALRHRFKGEFATKDSGAYQMAKDRGILDEICTHMENGNAGENNGNYKYTDKIIKEKASLFINPGEFKKNYPVLYSAAINRGILEEACKHMNYINHTPYTKEEMASLALTCKNRREFNTNYSGAYQAAFKLGVLDEICSHMSKSRSVSYMEIELFLTIKKVYESAKKISDYKVRIPGKPHIKRFHLDIYVPELNKAIEFDGKWWHSFGCMRAQEHKRNWPDEDIINYTNIKDSWFLTKNIEVLHVKEEDWLADKQACINKCFDFLKY